MTSSASASASASVSVSVSAESWESGGPATAPGAGARWDSLEVEDAPALTALLNRIDAADGTEDPAEEPSTREWLTVDGRDLARDSIAVRAPGRADFAAGRLVAFGLLDVSPSLDRDGRVRCSLMGGVDPEHRRQGLGGRILDELSERAAAQAAAQHPGEPAVLRVGGGRDPESAPAVEAGGRAGEPADGPVDAAPGGGADIRPLLLARGFSRVRSWLEMERTLTGDEAEAPAVGEIAVVAPAEDRAEATRLAHIAAFADHWGSTPPTAERWATLWGSHTARREHSTIAVGPDGAVLGYVLTSEDIPGSLHIALVGTRPEARGRGLARAMIARSLASAARAGFASARLEVDAESLTGATRLYEGLGFTAQHVYATFERELRP